MMSISVLRFAYAKQEGRGIGLANKVAAYALQDGGLDTVDANRHLGFDDDLRSYEAVEHILADMGIKVRVLCLRRGLCVVRSSALISGVWIERQAKV